MFQLGYQSAGETRQQTVLHPLKVDRRTVGSQNNLLAQTEQVVEDMEERIERLCCCCTFLNIIYNEYVNGLIELDEVVDLSPNRR